VLVWSSGVKLHSAGHIGEARERYEQAIAMEPPYPYAFESYGLSLALVEPTDPVRAGKLWAEFARLYGYPFPDGVDAFVETLLESVQAVGMPAQEAQAAALSLLDDVVERTQLDRGDLLFEYCGLTSADVCFDLLGEALRMKSPWVALLPRAVVRPDILGDPRWKEFLTRIGYPGPRY